MSYTEANDLYWKWKTEQKQKDIQVGDVVEVKGHFQLVVVMAIYDAMFEGYDGITYQMYSKENAKKTGEKVELAKLFKEEIKKLHDEHNNRF